MKRAKAVAHYENEAALVADFVEQLHKSQNTRQTANRKKHGWTVYPETNDYDLFMVHENGFQLGLEAKMSLNAKCIDQALNGQHYERGPDYRGVLVPQGKVQLHLGNICQAVGLGVIQCKPVDRHGYGSYFDLPTQESRYSSRQWPAWCPAERLPVPDYVPDVEAGHACPVQLTDWKIRAIKLVIVLDAKGFVTRKDMKALGISPTRWTDHSYGMLAVSNKGEYVRCKRTPDFRQQHPVNFVQIEKDVKKWGRFLSEDKKALPSYLVEKAA